jgi:hypothetical protein
MRRLCIWALAVGYGVSFVAVCLAACLTGPAADHACCPTDDGLRAADKDCCSVTPGVSHGGAATPVVVSRLTAIPTLVVELPVAYADLAPVRAAASPPLILRI